MVELARPSLWSPALGNVRDEVMCVSLESSTLTERGQQLGLDMCQEREGLILKAI